MKKFLVFTVLLASSFKSLACGYSPYGEDIRYCLFKPEYFSYSHYMAFYYNANLWGYDDARNPNNYKTNVEANILDWYNFAKKKVSIEAIGDFNNNLTLTDIHPKSGNEFIQYLYQNRQFQRQDRVFLIKHFLNYSVFL